MRCTAPKPGPAASMASPRKKAPLAIWSQNCSLCTHEHSGTSGDARATLPRCHYTLCNGCITALVGPKTDMCACHVCVRCKDWYYVPKVIDSLIEAGDPPRGAAHVNICN